MLGSVCPRVNYYRILSAHMRKRSFSKKEEGKTYRTNDEITSSEVRVVGIEGEQLGVLKLEDALARAEEEGVDLVEVSPNSEPPVCRILDYGKLRYKEQKKAAEGRKQSAKNTVKELRVRYRTDTHDLDTIIRKARQFLEAGDRVRFQMRFRGREVVYRDLGLEKFEEIKTLLEDIATVEDQTPLQGNRMILTFAPTAPTKKPAEGETA